MATFVSTPSVEKLPWTVRVAVIVIAASALWVALAEVIG